MIRGIGLSQPLSPWNQPLARAQFKELSQYGRCGQGFLATARI